MKAYRMSEPVLPTLAGVKFWLFGLPIVVSILAFWLGLMVIPLRAGREVRDLIYRVLSCAVSSFVFGIPALIALKKYMPFAFDEVQVLASMAGTDPMVGFFMLCGCVMLVCSLPGPWIVASFFLFVEKQKGKPIDEVIRDLRGDVKA